MIYFAAIIIGLLQWVNVCLAQGTEAVYTKLETLSPEKRQETLIEGAKKEGTLVVYGTSSMMIPLLKAFAKKYPFIETKHVREGRSAALAARALAEIRSGRYIGDTVAGAGTALPIFLDAGVLAAYNSPERKYIPKDYRDENGFWTSAYLQETIFGYNTDLVEPKMLPGSYFDLLDPYWKGKLVLDPLPNTFVRAALVAYGEEKALDLFKRLVRSQELQFHRGRTFQAQLLAAGQFTASPEQRLGTIKQLKEKGAPVGYHFTFPSAVEIRPSTIFKTAPHPHAAALFVDFWLSEEGQHHMAKEGYAPAREGLGGLDPMGSKNRVVIRPEWNQVWEKRVQEINQEIFIRSARKR